MTKVLLQYDLERPLTDADAKAISAVHAYYGFQRVQALPALDKISVEYDASRLSEKVVEAVLVNYGVPIKRK